MFENKSGRILLNWNLHVVKQRLQHEIWDDADEFGTRPRGNVRKLNIESDSASELQQEFFDDFRNG